ETAEGVHLRDQVSSLSGEKFALTAEVACNEAGTKITSLASERDRLASEVSSLRIGFKDFKDKMEIQQEEQAQELYNRVAELEAHNEVAPDPWKTTCSLQVLEIFRVPGILGHALGRAVDFGMQEGLEAGYEHGVAGRSLFVVDAYNPEV
ncbi:hypothetical protein Tco_0208976, partial [Tanacetum coccineum]